MINFLKKPIQTRNSKCTHNLWATLIDDFSFCCFYAHNKFFIFNGENQSISTLAEIMLGRSGYGLGDNPLKYREKIEKLDELIRGKDGLIINLKGQLDAHEKSLEQAERVIRNLE